MTSASTSLSLQSIVKVSACVAKQVTFHRLSVTQQVTSKQASESTSQIHMNFPNVPASVRTPTKSTTNPEGPVSKHRTNTDASRVSRSMTQGTEVQNKCAGNEVVRTENDVIQALCLVYVDDYMLACSDSTFGKRSHSSAHGSHKPATHTPKHGRI